MEDKLLIDKLLLEEYFGKDVVVNSLINCNFRIESVQVVSVEERLFMNQTFLETQNFNTRHIDYVSGCKYVEKVLLGDLLKEDFLEYYQCKADPNFVFGVLVNSSSKLIISCTKGFDIQRTSEKEWNKAWGKF